MKKAIIGIGTNIGDRLANIKDATEALALVPGVKVLRCASIYETAPWGYTEQSNFYNTVVEVETDISPDMLLGACLGIEAGMGRIREFKNGPRVIDLDLLFYEDCERNTEKLTLPHPRIGERDFVLLPLKELYNGMYMFGKSYLEQYEKAMETTTAKIIEKI